MSNYFLSYMQIIGQWPMPNGNPATPRQPSCTVSRQHNWTDCGRLGLMLCSQSLLRTVLELIGRNLGMLFAVRLDVWNRFRRCTSLMWLSRQCDVTRGRPECLQSQELPDCLNRLQNDSIMLRWQPQCIAKTLWAPLNCKGPFHTYIRGILGVRVMLFVEDPIVTVKCRTAIKELFLYFNLCLKCKVG
jgi:hypothetical protein